MMASLTKYMNKNKKYRVIPGFGLTLGITISMLSVISLNQDHFLEKGILFLI